MCEQNPKLMHSLNLHIHLPLPHRVLEIHDLSILLRETLCHDSAAGNMLDPQLFNLTISLARQAA